MNEATEAMLKESLEKCAIPEHMHDGVILYVTRGIPPGSFLYALLSNDLMESFSRADMQNLVAMRQWTLWLYNYAPRSCWGSEKRVNDWIDRKLRARQEA